MVSAIMAKIAPAATASVAATTTGENPEKMLYPARLAIDEMTAMPDHRPNTYVPDRPAFFMPAALDNPSGTFERNIAVTATRLTAPPCIIETPLTIDSGIPSNSAPTAIASPPSSDCLGPPALPDLFRCCPPRREM